MRKLGILVGEDENWSFFREIFSDLSKSYRTEVFTKREYTLPLLYGRLNRWAFKRQIQSLLRVCDVCFFEWASKLLTTACQMPKTCPIVTRLHSFELFVWAPRIDWKKVDGVVLLSQHMKNKFAELYPEHAHKIRVINNGVSIERFRFVETRRFNFTLGMLCNIHPIKRVYETILAVKDLRDQGFDPRLKIAGDRIKGGFHDQYFFAVQDLIKKMDLEEQVEMCGYVQQPAEWLGDIDIFVSNSCWEGQQVALLEAMASGCHCLAHFWGGVEEVLPADNIFVTGTELTAKIIEYAGKSEWEQSQLRQRMRSIAEEKFEISNTSERIRAMIEEITLKTLWT